MKKCTIAGSFIAGILACLFIVSMMSFNDESGTKPQKKTASFEPGNLIQAPSLPDRMDFAGEAVPLDRWEVREQFDRELIHNYYQQGTILYILKLSKKYFPQIEAQLKANNVPDDFKYLCVAESNLQNLISKAGATGFWQFMRSTAPGYNLEVAPTVDERYHIARSTDAACTYLKKAYERFGSWTAAAASYNCGMGGYSERSSNQGTTNYYELVLPDETQRYIFRILTFKHLLSHADSLGFKIPATQHYAPVKTRTVVIDQTIPNLVVFARNSGTGYKQLRWLNPWLRERSLKVRPGKKYEIILPAE